MTAEREARPHVGAGPGIPATGLTNIVDEGRSALLCQTCADFNLAAMAVEESMGVGGMHPAVQALLAADRVVVAKWQAGPGDDWDEWAASRPLGDPREAGR